MEDTYDEPERRERDYSRSPRRDRERSASPGGRAGGNHAPPAYDRRSPVEEQNAGTNLFVTGLITTLRDDELRELFRQHGDVEQASVVRDPHSRESRGFGFVNMMTPEDADAVIEKLQGFELHGRAISVEKAKRNRPRTPTPGRYQGPPKRDMRRGGGFGGGDRRDDRRGPPRDDYRGGGGYPRSGDRYSGDRYSSRDGDRRGDRGGDRGGDRRYRDRTDGYSSRGESYGGGGRRDDRDRYAGGDSRGGGSGGGYGYREPAGDYGGPPPHRPAYEERR